VSGVIALTRRPAFAELTARYEELKDRHLRRLFASNPDRAERFSAEGAGLYLDFSRNRITDTTLGLLMDLARQSGLEERPDAMFVGQHVNVSEDRAALHVALRMPQGTSLVADGVDVVAEVHNVLDAMAAFCERVRSGEWRGHTGKAMRNVVNIGIGALTSGR
jgi:glucose-6-phosphate isomerase